MSRTLPFFDIDDAGVQPVGAFAIAGQTIAPGEYPPHRHNFQEILWVEAGRGVHVIDDRAVALRPGTVALIARGQVHHFAEAEALHATVVRFTDAFVQHASAAQEAERAALFNYLSGDQTFPIPPAEHAAGMALLRLILDEANGPPRFGRADLLRALIQALLVQVERILRAAGGDPPDVAGQESLRLRFIRLLEAHFCERHDVAFYAAELGISPAQLSRALQAALGRPAKRAIADRVLLEARRYLQFTNLSVQEVAAALGYADPFHFSKAFKQHTGLSPLDYQARSNSLPD